MTQKVDKNDAILGFFHNWLLQLSPKFERIIVVCLEKGESDLPNNVRVLSLGKEKVVVGSQNLASSIQDLEGELIVFDCSTSPLAWRGPLLAKERGRGRGN